MPDQPTRQADRQAEFSGERVHVNATVLVGRPATIESATEARSEKITRGNFKDPSDKVSQPVKGKYTHVPYSSEDLIRDKKYEAPDWRIVSHSRCARC